MIIEQAVWQYLKRYLLPENPVYYFILNRIFLIKYEFAIRDLPIIAVCFID